MVGVSIVLWTNVSADKQEAAGKKKIGGIGKMI